MVERYRPGSEIPTIAVPISNPFLGRRSKLVFLSTGCTLLDCIVGGGWPFKRVVNVIGDKCLSGDTIVSVCRGGRLKKMTIATLYSRVNGSHHNRNAKANTTILSDLGGYVGKHQMLSVQKTGNKLLYSVTTDDNVSIKVSRDHQFKTDKGWQTIATGLAPGTNVYCWRGKQTGREERPKRSATYSIPHHPKRDHWKEHADDMRRDTNRTVLRKIKSIERLSVMPTFDISTEAPHNNFVANGFVVHNSTGKTLLAEEAMLLFYRKYKRKSHYRETESAFDNSYFDSLGGNADQMIDFGPNGTDTHWQTVEQIIDDLSRLMDKIEDGIVAKAKKLKELKANKKKKLSDLEPGLWKELSPELYIIDSLDSLSSEDEVKRDIHEGSYNLSKQKLLGEFFRKEVGRLKKCNILLFIISQTRDRIGPMIRGKKYRRHCDKVLDFYCSAVVYLADLGKVYETNKGIKRPVAIKIKAKCDKNKISMPFRECVFELRFGYGMDDDYACLDYLKEVGRLKDMGLKEYPKSLKDIDTAELKRVTIKVWGEIESMFVPKRGKYAAEDRESA